MTEWLSLSRKRGFPVDWVLSERKWGKSVTVGNLPYLEDWRNEVGPELWLEKEQQFLILARVGGCLVIFVVWKKFIILSMFTHDYRVALFLSWCIMVTEWSHLLLMFCEITYVQLNLQALLCVLGLFLAVGTPFVFLTNLIFSHLNWIDCGRKKENMHKPKEKKFKTGKQEMGFKLPNICVGYFCRHFYPYLYMHIN